MCIERVLLPCFVLYGNEGTLTEFKPESEKIEAYLERVQLFFDANTIAEDKQVIVLLTVIGSSTYTLLTCLLALHK